MEKKEIGSIPQVAQGLIGHLPKALDDQLKSLIAQAEAGQNVTTKLIDLFSQHEVTQLWLKEQLDLQSKEMGAPSFSSLAGNQNLVPLSQKWICQKKPRDHWMLVIREGEDPPICEKHNIDMIRGNEKKGDHNVG